MPTTQDHDRAVLGRLVADGTLSPEQAEAVAAALAARSPADPPADPPGLPVAAEALAYLGAAVAGAAALALAGRVWHLLEPLAQAALLAIASAALWGAGRWVHREHAPAPVGRLVGFCWLLACAAAAGATAVAVDGTGLLPDDRAVIPTALTLLALGGVCWRARPSVLTLLPLHAGAHLLAVGVLLLAESPPEDLFGVVVWAVGAAGLVLAWGGVLRPTRAAYVLGALGVLVGAQALAFVATWPGLLLGAASSGALLGAVRLRQGALVGLGAAGLAVFGPQILVEAFPDAVAAPVAVFVGGVALLGVALAAVRGQARS